MIVRKLRLERGWSQETLAELSGLNVRTIQRIERGANASLESSSALAAVFQVDIATLSKEITMQQHNDVSREEREAMEYVRDIKAFYAHLVFYLASIVMLGIFNLVGPVEGSWYAWTLIGWGLGVAAHGLSVFEMFSLFGPGWERRQIERRLRRRRG